MTQPLSPDIGITSGTRHVKRYIILILMLFSIVVSSIFFSFSLSTRNLITEQLYSQAKSLYSSIVLTRIWAAKYQGVYVPLADDGDINPYLQSIPGLKPVITDSEGVSYTLKNPALITREISELGQERNVLIYKITSLTPLNQANMPDQFEAEALKAFAEGLAEVSSFEDKDGQTFYRYMAPLMTEDVCLRCHAAQGYSVGDVRGGISVTIPATDVRQRVNMYTIYSVISAFLVLVLVVILIAYISRYFIRDIKRAEEKIIEYAVTDFLTGVYNRGYGMQLLARELSRQRRGFDDFCVLMIDLDYFKKINDTFGHRAGDKVLVEFAKLLRQSVRDYDIVCRYGGEEFLLVLPGSTLDNCRQLAERIREKTLQMAIHSDGEQVPISMSGGVARLENEDTVDSLLKRADDNLYEAKRRGRNRIV